MYERIKTTGDGEKGSPDSVALGPQYNQRGEGDLI